MSKCKSYNCWFKKKLDSPFCSSCQKEDDNKFIEACIVNPCTLIGTAQFSRALVYGDTLDRVLKSIYSYSTSFLRIYLKSIKDIHVEKQLFLRIQLHTSTDLCPVIGWMIRNDMFPESIRPSKCLHCVSHIVKKVGSQERNLIAYGIEFGFYDSLRKDFNFKHLLEISSRESIKELAHAIIYSEGDTFLYKQYLRQVAEKDPELMHEVLEDFARIPQTLLHNVKDELLAISMHPSRAFHWCLDEESKADYPHNEYVFTQGRAPWSFTL